MRFVLKDVLLLILLTWDVLYKIFQGEKTNFLIF